MTAESDMGNSVSGRRLGVLPTRCAWGMSAPGIDAYKLLCNVICRYKVQTD